MQPYLCETAPVTDEDLRAMVDAMEKMDEIAEIARDEYGVTVTQVDTREWKDASAKVAEKYKGGIDTEYWNAFYE